MVRGILRVKFLRLFFVFWIATAALLTPQPSSAAGDEKTYSPEEIMAAAESVFGEASKGLAEVIEKLFAEQGRPSAYIAGEEISGAFVVGLRYGKGDLNIKGQKSSPIYWQGPSIGFDFGGNASKAFVLIHSTRLNGINT